MRYEYRQWRTRAPSDTLVATITEQETDGWTLVSVFNNHNDREVLAQLPTLCLLFRRPAP